MISNFIDLINMNWIYTQQAIQYMQNKWYWNWMILIVTVGVGYILIKKAYVVPMVLYGPFTSVMINNYLILKLLPNMNQLEMTQCTSMGLVVGTIVGLVAIGSLTLVESDMMAASIFGLLFVIPILSVLGQAAMIIIIGMIETFKKEPLAIVICIMALGAIASIFYPVIRIIVVWID